MTASVKVFLPEETGEIARKALETKKKQEYSSIDSQVVSSFNFEVSCEGNDGGGRSAVYTGKASLVFPEDFDHDKVSEYYLPLAMELVPKIIGLDWEKSKEGFALSEEGGSVIYSRYSFSADSPEKFAEFSRKLLKAYAVLYEEILSDSGKEGKFSLNFAKKNGDGQKALPAPKEGGQAKPVKVKYLPEPACLAIYSSDEIAREIGDGHAIHFFLGTPRLYELDPVRNRAKDVEQGWHLIDRGVNAIVSYLPEEGGYREVVELAFPDEDCPEIFKDELGNGKYSAKTKGKKLTLSSKKTLPKNRDAIGDAFSETVVGLSGILMQFTVPQEKEGLYLALPIADYQPEPHLLRGAVAEYALVGKCAGLGRK